MDTENTTNKGFEFDPEKNQKSESNFNAENQSQGYQGTEKASVKPESKQMMQQTLPNSGGILAMGIISIVFFCCCYGGISIVLSIVALALASKANKMYQENPQAFTLKSYKNMKAGQVTAIIGLSLAGLIMIIMIIVVASGINILSTEEALKEFENAWESTGY